MKLLKGTLPWVLVFLLVAPVAWGQTGTSTIRGTVVDPQGLVVSGATVTLTNSATQAVRTTQSTGTGAYVFDLVTPADYRLDVEAKGFKKAAVSNVHASIGKPVEITVKLQVGTAGEVVEVRASAQETLINTQDATLGNNFIAAQIGQLPLEGRGLSDLLSLQAGTTREGYVTGARADQANVTLDGVDINDAQNANAIVPAGNNTLVIGELGNPVLRLNAEAVEEFRVTTANGNANQGRSSGAQVNLVTKSGTNNWHGAAFEFYRSRGFTANDWFNNHSTPKVPRTPLIRHTFGGAVGGPIIKNRAFFFYSFESRHDATATSETRVVPLPSLGTGAINYTYCSNPPACTSTAVAALNLAQNQAAFSQTGINAAAVAAIAAAAAKYPANDSSQGDQLNTSGFRFNAATPVRLNSHVAKLDFNLTSKQTLFARLNVVYDHQGLPPWFPDTPAPQLWSHPWGLAVGHTWTINNHWVNNFRYGFTRQAFSQGGDSNGNDISFRFVFQPNAQTHTVNRVTPVHNFTDDVSWIHGKHTIQFGGNVRLVKNSRVSFANAFDNAITNPSFYLSAGDSVNTAFQNYIDANNLPGNTASGSSVISVPEVQNAGTAIIGRFSQYTANFTFDKDGTLLNPGSAAIRSFATQAYDFYVQDTWRLRPSLTLTLGLRYSLERPVYETQGFEVQPEVPLGTYFAQRLAAGQRGENFTDPIVINRSGPANGGKPLYNWDKNNFQPRIAVAWAPEGGDGILGRLLGRGRKSVLRGGFAMTNDYYGQALAVDFDLNNTLGFTSNYTTPANTYDIVTTSRPLAPLFTDFNQDVRSLPNVVVPGSLVFPLTASPLDPANGEYGERIESSVDSRLHAPTEYVWNVTYERELPKGMLLSASYVGRIGRSLLARRDAAAFNDLRDPATGMDWYAAGTELEKLRQLGTDINQIPALLSPEATQYFNDMFPAGLSTIVENFEGAGFDPTWTNAQVFYAFNRPTGPIGYFSGNDWTDTQAEIDLDLAFSGYPIRFMQPQYGALSAWSTVGNSRYDALVISLRQRLPSLTLDFNYTYSHSFDDASGLQTAGAYDTSPFIVNPIRQHDYYASSDFDIRHVINANGVWQLPFGKGKRFLADASKGVDAILGGWQLSGIFRWNTGIPQFQPYDSNRWATNWNVQAGVTPTRPVHTCPDRPVNGTPKLFGACGDINQVYQSFRNAYPGESGPRNMFRLPGYTATDLGIAKTFHMPWNESHLLQLRWDVFNVFNQQHFGAIDGSRTGFGVGRDPALNNTSAPSNWSNFIQIQGQPRVMQIGVRFSF